MVRPATIGRRGNEDRELSDSTCTPQWLAERFPVVDFDPCSNPRSHIRARWSWSLEKGYDGRKMPWRGSGFINWPFSAPGEWASKANYELSLGRCTNLIVICKEDPSTSWWPIITAPILTVIQRGSKTFLEQLWYPDLWLFHDRVQYDEHPELIARRARDYADAKARGDKPKGRPNGKSTANFCSVIIHHRFGGTLLPLEDVADRYVRGR